MLKPSGVVQKNLLTTHLFYVSYFISWSEVCASRGYEADRFLMPDASQGIDYFTTGLADIGFRSDKWEENIVVCHH